MQINFVHDPEIIVYKLKNKKYTLMVFLLVQHCNQQ